MFVLLTSFATVQLAGRQHAGEEHRASTGNALWNRHCWGLILYCFAAVEWARQVTCLDQLSVIDSQAKGGSRYGELQFDCCVQQAKQRDVSTQEKALWHRLLVNYNSFLSKRQLDLRSTRSPAVQLLADTQSNLIHASA